MTPWNWYLYPAARLAQASTVPPHIMARVRAAVKSGILPSWRPTATQILSTIGDTRYVHAVLALSLTEVSQ